MAQATATNILGKEAGNTDILAACVHVWYCTWTWGFLVWRERAEPKRTLFDRPLPKHEPALMPSRAKAANVAQSISMYSHTPLNVLVMQVAEAVLAAGHL